MIGRADIIRSLLYVGFLCILPALAPPLLHWILQGDISLTALGAGWLLAVVTLLGAIVYLHLARLMRLHIWVATICPALLLIAVSGAYIWVGSSILSWMLLCALWILLLVLSTLFRGGYPRWLQAAIASVLLGVAIIVPIALEQIDTRFAEEEFFVALQALALLPYTLLLFFVWGRLPHKPKFTTHLPLKLVATGMLLLFIVGTVGTWWAYSRSFYPDQAPLFPGLSMDTPFICNELEHNITSGDHVDERSGAEIFDKLLAAIAANPRRSTPELGMLALGRGDSKWADEFRLQLLEEARAGRFTRSAHSIKSVQYDAALRVYYFDKVRDVFPELFTVADVNVLQEWFASINRRALTVEWVDWFYALAFTKWPEGPYENQEIGAGLLALLESTGLADPALRAQNRAYLDRNMRGWQARFRNTDDSFYYQPPWITDAYFQAIYTDRVDTQRQAQSFEWLLLQMLPDGSAPHYNHVVKPSMAGIAYLGAAILEDERYLWLAEHTLTTDLANSVYPLAQPGIEDSVSLIARSPTQGSCLLYGNSGLPNQEGPLAPDKIVFRDGWNSENHYLLLNLRFAGWHRYKATNAISLIFAGAPVVHEVLNQPPYRWLPAGRSLFRDRRIPRQNLNGLLIENSGLSEVLTLLSGVGGIWAQDPPYYAEVVAFETGDGVDRSHTRLVEWRGWQHDRWVHFYHNGPIVVIDQAEGPAYQRAALSWHFADMWQEISQNNRDRILIGNESDAVEIVFLATGRQQHTDEYQFNIDTVMGTNLLIHNPVPGHLGIATIFLPGQWRGAKVQVDGERAEIVIEQGSQQIYIPTRQ